MTKTTDRLVTIKEFPISDRYCYAGAIGKISGNQIRVGGCWFDFDKRWVVENIIPN